MSFNPAMGFPFIDFINASATGNMAYILKHLAGHPDINYRNENGWSALSVASYEHHYEIAKLLITNGADINLTNYKGTTIFMYAKTKCLASGNYKFLDYLLNHGADVNALDSAGLSVLDYVELTNKIKMINYLRSRGALRSSEINNNK